MLFMVRGSMAALAWMKECPFDCGDARSTSDIGRRIGQEWQQPEKVGRSPSAANQASSQSTVHRRSWHGRRHRVPAVPCFLSETTPGQRIAGFTALRSRAGGACRCDAHRGGVGQVDRAAAIGKERKNTTGAGADILSSDKHPLRPVANSLSVLPLETQTCALSKDELQQT